MLKSFQASLKRLRETGASTPKSLSSKALCKIVEPYTFAIASKLANLRRIAQQVAASGISGDVVECGTYRGGSAAVLGTTLRPDQHLWLYDSFQGMPETTSADGEHARQYVGKGVASPNDVREVLTKVGVRPEQYTICPGWFAESFQKQAPARVAFLHCDADWYESVLLVLETFYPRMPEGGCVVLDDFGYWEGCREAFYTFCERHNERPLLERFDIDQAWWFKGRQNNRS